MTEVTIELYGIPRQRAGIAQMAVAACTAADALQQLAAACPNLDGLLQKNGALSPHYLLSLNGERFLSDLQERVPPGTRLLLLAADAGG